MTHRGHLRALVSVLAAVATVAGAGGMVAAPAAADVQQPLVVAEGQTLTRSYPPLGAPEPSGTATGSGAFSDPDSCSTAPGHVCDVVPIHIGEPSDPTDYVVRIRVTFKAEPVGNGVTATDDIDIYLWDDPPKDRPGPGEQPDGTPDEIMHSAGSSTTESVGIDSEPGRKFSLVVYHAGGQNTGYTVNVRYFPGGGVRPDESIEPGFVPDLSGGTGTPAPAPARFRPTPSFGDLPSPVGNLGPGLDVGGGAPYLDPDLANLGGSSELDRANAAAELFGKSTGTVAPPRPVSGRTVALWLTITPVLLLAAGLVVLMRRRPAALLVR